MKLLAVALLALAVPASAVGALEVKLSVVPKAPKVGAASTIQLGSGSGERRTAWSGLACSGSAWPAAG
jgi:hypothetical protein